jgi:hypothetical protein
VARKAARSLCFRSVASADLTTKGCIGNGPQDSITRNFWRSPGTSPSRRLKTFESMAAASASPRTTASMEFRCEPEQNTRPKIPSSAPIAASLFRRL